MPSSLLAASLTRGEYGVEEEDAKKGNYVAYILYAVMKDMRAHTEHDEDERFTAFLKKARGWQPEGPSAWAARGNVVPAVQAQTAPMTSPGSRPSKYEEVTT